MFPLLLALPIFITTRDPLTVTQHTYASIAFTAKASPAPALPPQFTFTTSGRLPSGMIFESYPCHKPGLKNCPALASSDTLFLDGVPTTSGVFRVQVTAQGPDGGKTSTTVTVQVKPSRR